MAGSALWDDNAELVWEEPPAKAINPRGAKSYWNVLAEKLRERPNEWLRTPREYTEQTCRQTVQAIRSGKYSAMPKGEFEAVYSEGRVWAKYVGKAEATDPPSTPTRPTLVPSTQRRQQRRDTSAETGKIRAWARANGFPDLPDHGRLPNEVTDAYNAAMDAEEGDEA